jgi:nitroreductase
VTLDLTLDELLTTTRAVRKRLDLERPVEREVIQECIEIALQAPSASNTQDWQWMVVTDPERKRGLADLYGAVFDDFYAPLPIAPFEPDDPRGSRQEAVRSSATYLREHFHEVPALVIPLHKGRADGLDAASAAAFWGSILPAVWNFMLALRARGLGSAWTMMHLYRAEEAAELLGIPHDGWTQAGLFPVAYTKGTDFKPAARIPTDDLIHWDTW